MASRVEMGCVGVPVAHAAPATESLIRPSSTRPLKPASRQSTTRADSPAIVLPRRRTRDEVEAMHEGNFLEIGAMKEEIERLHRQLQHQSFSVARARAQEEEAKLRLRAANLRVNDLESKNATLEASLLEAQADIERVAAELAEEAARLGGARLSWQSVTSADGSWRHRITELTGLGSGEVLIDLYNLLNWNGQAEALKLWNGRQSSARMEAERSGTSQRRSGGHQDKVITPQDAFLLTLTKLRTGLSLSLLSTWAGISYGGLARAFPTWVNFMAQFFRYV